ncbi:excisionase [Bacillus phage vB_BcM_Sam46]|uniref:Excisionase n=2 Tax=Caudoviricetes TaxID=2731619 RepID=A0A6G9L6S0_9CAUD|nr:excisionase [Bacillus phage vB_BcM_Sam112]QIQ61260.1 excisionase [Bacillus phage vB_BcM_Sam46]
MSNLLTTKQLAEKLQVAEITIHKWRTKGFPFIKLGRSVRFDFVEVQKWIEEQNKAVK